jgi:hypothetical protein
VSRNAELAERKRKEAGGVFVRHGVSKRRPIEVACDFSVPHFGRGESATSCAKVAAGSVKVASAVCEALDFEPGMG